MEIKKKNTDLLDGNGACAHAAVLSRVQSFPCFPITPQTELLHLLADWKAKGIFKGQYNLMDSEHSVLSAAFGSASVGARTFTATSSQGLMYMHEVLPIVSGNRLPIVMVNGSRGLSAPVTLWQDHNDILAMRDSGWLMIITQDNQELLDSIILSFKVSENPNVLLPSLVNMDGFIQSLTRIPVDLPDIALVDKFLPKLNLEIKLDVDNPISLGVPVMSEYMDFRAQVHKAQENALQEMQSAFTEWNSLTGRKYDFIDSFQVDDAEIILVIAGAISLTARAAITELRSSGEKVGLLRLRVLRPFPREIISKSLSNSQKIIVVDQDISPGFGGVLYGEICSLVDDAKVSSFIAGLGGRHIGKEDFKKIIIKVSNSSIALKAWVF